MDHLDHRILRELKRDGRIANTQLAERVGLSPSACLRRVQAMEKSGAIRGYRAVTDPTKMGTGFVAFLLVGLSDHSKKALERFERTMLACPEITECHNITGTAEYLLRVEAADLAAYKAIHTDVVSALDGVRQLTTHVVVGTPKDERG